MVVVVVFVVVVVVYVFIFLDLCFDVFMNRSASKTGGRSHGTTFRKNIIFVVRS